MTEILQILAIGVTVGLIMLFAAFGAYAPKEFFLMLTFQSGDRADKIGSAIVWLLIAFAAYNFNGDMFLTYLCQTFSGK